MAADTENAHDAPRHSLTPRLAEHALEMLRSLPLEPTDAYVLSRIDGVTLADEIVDACGLDAATVTQSLSRMTAMGLIEWGERSVSQGPGAPSVRPGERVSGTRTIDGRDTGGVQTPMSEQFERFARVTHYQLLGLEPTSSDDEVERAHARARNLEAGTLAAELGAGLGADTALSRLLTAYEVLISPERRREYDAYLLYREETSAIEEALSQDEGETSFVPPRVKSSAIVPKENSTASPHLSAEKMTTDYLLAALREREPDRAKRKRAERLVRDAMAERDAENLVGATNALRLAHAILPDCKVLGGAVATVAREMNESLASTLRVRAMYEEDFRMWEEAAETWEKVLVGQPGDARAARGVAHALLEAGGDLHRALRRAEEAVEAAPEDPSCQRTLARVYIATGMSKSAQRALNLAENLESREKDRHG